MGRDPIAPLHGHHSPTFEASVVGRMGRGWVVTPQELVAEIKKHGILFVKNEKMNMGKFQQLVSRGRGSAALLETFGMGILWEPLDIAEGVVYLASDAAKFVTGTELVIDEGFLAR